MISASPLRLDTVCRCNGQVVWLLRAADDTWRYVLTAEHLTDARTPGQVLSMPTVGPFATREAAQDAGFARVGGRAGGPDRAGRSAVTKRQASPR